MGYAAGSEVITSGGESTRTLKSFYEWGAFAIRQKSVVTTKKYTGVSLATCQSYHASDNLTAINGGSGSLAWIIFDAEGTKTTVSYSQIGDSNLYDLTITTENLNAWQSSTHTRPVN